MMRLLRHKLLWMKETVLMLLAAAHIPLWLWLPVSGYGWLALHVILPVTMALIVWLAWRIAKAGLGVAGRVSWPLLLVCAASASLCGWGLLSFVPTFGLVGMQTASFVTRTLLAAVLAAGLLLLPFARASND
jgi:hypothetical protein